MYYTQGPNHSTLQHNDSIILERYESFRDIKLCYIQYR